MIGVLLSMQNSSQVLQGLHRDVMWRHRGILTGCAWIFARFKLYCNFTCSKYDSFFENSNCSERQDLRVHTSLSYTDRPSEVHPAVHAALLNRHKLLCLCCVLCWVVYKLDRSFPP